MDNTYRIFFKVLPNGVQALWNFPSIGNQRTSGFMCKGRVFPNLERAVKYAESYVRHYPKKGLSWLIETPSNTAFTRQGVGVALSSNNQGFTPCG